MCVVDSVLVVKRKEYNLEKFVGYSMEKDEFESSVGSHRS